MQSKQISGLFLIVFAVAFQVSQVIWAEAVPTKIEPICTISARHLEAGPVEGDKVIDVEVDTSGAIFKVRKITAYKQVAITSSVNEFTLLEKTERGSVTYDLTQPGAPKLYVGALTKDISAIPVVVPSNSDMGDMKNETLTIGRSKIENEGDEPTYSAPGELSRTVSGNGKGSPKSIKLNVYMSGDCYQK